MSYPATVFKVMIASPSDVATERNVKCMRHKPTTSSRDILVRWLNRPDILDTFPQTVRCKLARC